MSLITTQGCNIKSQNQNINFRQSGISVPAPNLIDNSIKRNSNITPLQADRVEISANSKKKKKKLSGFQKFAIGLGVLAGTGLVCLKGGHIYCKSAIKKAFKESQLKEHIDFKIANTIEEAREFTVKELGIKEVDKDIPLEVLNYINSEFAMVCNANKGKLVVPKRLVYKDLNKGIAGEADELCNLYVNKSVLEKHRDRLKLFQKIRQADSFADVSGLMNEKDSISLLSKYYSGFNARNMNVYYNDIISQNRRDILEFKDVIGHEDGHLNDMYKNMETLLKELSFTKYVKQLFTRKPRLENRWGCIERKEYKDLFKNNPKEFKKQCPDLYEFLTNKETQDTAGEVSEYAKSGIGEFIAETYAKLLKKEKVSDKVMALYKKYNGPTPNA